MIESLVRSAIQHLGALDSCDQYPLYTYDRDDLHRLATADPWSDHDKRAALFLFAKYRRILMRDGFNYYTVFPRTKWNHDEEVRVKKVYQYMDYLVRTHGLKPPHGFDLRPLDDVERWVREKIIEMRIKHAGRNGVAVAANK